MAARVEEMAALVVHKEIVREKRGKRDRRERVERESVRVFPKMSLVSSVTKTLGLITKLHGLTPNHKLGFKKKIKTQGFKRKK